MQLVTTHPQFSQIVSTLPTYQGYIRPSGRYFQDEAGQSFIVIGQNDAITWPGLVELLDRSSSQTVEDYIVDLRAHGINTSRVMMEYAQFESAYLETRVGKFSPSVVQFWDEFIPLAERHGLYLLLTPYDSFWQVKNWDRYPYSGTMGGPCVEMRDWITSPACIHAHKVRWEFIIRRWGGSPNILAWDLMNEVDLYWGATAEEIDAYVTEMAAFVRETELRYWGKTHMLTISSAAAVPSGKLGRVIYDHPALDFATTHLYVGPGVREPVDPVECVDEMIDAVQLCLQSICETRPYFDSESGPMDIWITDTGLEKAYHHNMSWAHLASGGGGSGLRWPYTHPHCLLPVLRENLLGLARFATSVDWARFDSRNITTKIRVSTPDILKTGCASDDLAVVWLLADTRRSQAASLSGAGVKITYVLQDGEYEVEAWETYNGQVIDRFTATARYGKMSFTLPEFEMPLQDVALIIRRRD